ncbi:MAG: hypothetical protein Q9174_004869 [Haloplaca sp. 1 TL-2023]
MLVLMPWRLDRARKKMESGDGLSFAEFTYPILQAYDWWHMYNNFPLNGVQLQIGGSDQYGNIMAGVDAVNYIRRNHYAPEIRQTDDTFTKKPMGFTTPLLTTSSGAKFGKSAGNAIWLDKDMTSPFDLYQFFLRSSDDDVHRYLKLFTFMPFFEIEQVMTEQNLDRSKRVAQRRLAREVLSLVHGEEEVKAVEAQHGIFFKPSKTALKRMARDASQPREAGHGKSKSNDITPLLNKHAGPDKPGPASSVTLPRSLVFDQQIGRVLYAAGVVSSRSEGHRLIAKKGAYVGSLPGKQHTNMGNNIDFTPVGNWTNDYINRFIIDEQLLVLRAGKWRVKMITIIPDAEFERRGLDAPGWKECKESQHSGHFVAFEIGGPIA